MTKPVRRPLAEPCPNHHEGWADPEHDIVPSEVRHVDGGWLCYYVCAECSTSWRAWYSLPMGYQLEDDPDPVTDDERALARDLLARACPCGGGVALAYFGPTPYPAQGSYVVHHRDGCPMASA